MAGNSAFDFASPAKYSDWANYAGFNRTTGEIEGMSSQAGVPPPENLQGYMNQRLGSMQNKLSAIAPAVQQASQGNVMKAVGMVRNPTAPVAPTIPGATTPPAAAPVNNDYDYESGIENSGLNFSPMTMPTFG
jgi:hypothetical protein